MLLCDVLHLFVYLLPNSATERPNVVIKNETKELIRAEPHKPTQVRDANKVKKKTTTLHVQPLSEKR